MDVSATGMLFIAKVLMLSGLVGFAFTVGAWGFCKMAGWAPVNLTVNNYATRKE